VKEKEGRKEEEREGGENTNKELAQKIMEAGTS
jgi:hypothetical protein